MPTVHHRDVKEIFHESLRRAPGEPRKDYLEQACDGDPDLRSEVESLLASLDDARSFLEMPLMAEDERPDADHASLSSGLMISHYRIERLIGCGGMGEVYLATDKILKRRVALKVIPEALATDPCRIRRFRREAEMVAELNHPNILTIYEFGTSGNNRFIVSEFIEGETVRKRICRGPLPIGEVLDIAIQVASALSAAHEVGMIHRDIKPENIMIRKDGYVKVLDFGLAKLIGPTVRALSAMVSMSSQPGIIMGTSNYISPEQARGREIDHRTDLFSFGVVLYEMLTNIQPFKGETAVDAVAEIIQCEPPPLDALDERIPKPLAEIVRRLLEKEPINRYCDAAELRSDLIAVRDSLTPAERSVSAPITAEVDTSELPTIEYPSKYTVIRPILLILAMVAALFFIFWAVYFTYIV